MDNKEILQVSSKGATILKKVTAFDAISRVPTNNKPHIPQGDTKKAVWYRQVHDVVKVLATARLQGDALEVLISLELYAPDARKLLDTAFTVLASLSYSIELLSKLSVNRTLETPSKSAPLLFGKDEVQLLQQRRALMKHMPRSFSHSNPPYRKDYRKEYGEGKKRMICFQ